MEGQEISISQMNTIQKMLARTVTRTHFSRTKQWILPALALGLITAQSTAQTFTGEGNWKNEVSILMLLS